MSKTDDQAKVILEAVEKGTSIAQIRADVSTTENEWYRFGSKAYQVALRQAEKQLNAFLKKPHTSATSNDEIKELIELNIGLANYALCLPATATMAEFEDVKKLMPAMPATEGRVIAFIKGAVMQPRMRILQKKGRFETLDHFKVFYPLIDAAMLCYYRSNFISCYMTLLPVIEGVIIRWIGYSNEDEKPEFEEIRSFFRKSPQRHPAPRNILFHNVYVKACDKILNDHFYRPTRSGGTAYKNFNRHIAAHLLTDTHFATQDNCLRLFILLDMMTEIFLYESDVKDPRFTLTAEEIGPDINRLTQLIFEGIRSPEKEMLGDVQA